MRTKIQKIMSRLYWKERRKGNNHRYAFMKIRKKAIPLKIRKPYRDNDKDGIINKYDCEPKNRWKQDEDEIEIGKPTDNPDYETDFDGTLKKKIGKNKWKSKSNIYPYMINK